jgi:hypothetical protein
LELAEVAAAVEKALLEKCVAEVAVVPQEQLLSIGISQPNLVLRRV